MPRTFEPRPAQAFAVPSEGIGKSDRSVVEPVDDTSCGSDGTSARYSIVEITPVAAAGLLLRRRSGTRRRAAVVRACADAMRDGQWFLDGTPVVLSREGVLIDGLQRVLACIESACAFETLLADGIDETVSLGVRRMDGTSRLRRSGSAGMVHVRVVRAALTEMLRLNADAMAWSASESPGWAMLDEALRTHPRIGEAVQEGLAMAPSPLPEPVRGALICIGYGIDRGAVERLLEAVARPDDFAGTEPGVVLRRQMDAPQPVGPPHAAGSRLLAMAISALHATLDSMSPASGAFQLPASGHAAGPPARGGAAAPVAGRSDDEVRDRDTPTPTPMPEVSAETIDPLRAAHHLLGAIPGGRISRLRVEAMACDIVDYRWITNGYPICFAASGRLLDGHHRLRAIILSGRAIELPILRGLREGPQPDKKGERRRHDVNVEPFESFGDRALLAAMANLLWRHEIRAPSDRSGKAPPAEISAIIARHPRLLMLRGYARRMMDFAHPSVIGYGAYTMERSDEALAHRFLESFETGANLGPGHPILALRNVMLKQRVAKASQAMQLTIFLAGWAGFRAWHASPHAHRRGSRHKGIG